jgi:hypothetical protein
MVPFFERAGRVTLREPRLRVESTVCAWPQTGRRTVYNYHVHPREPAPRMGRATVFRPLPVLLATSDPGDPTCGAPKPVLRLGAAMAESGHEVDYRFADDVPARPRDHRVLDVNFLRW